MQHKHTETIGLLLKEAGYANGDAVVAGVSGGPDSIALLHQLADIISPLCLHVAHLDHGMRPQSADDVRFVAAAAEKWGLPFHSKRVEVPELARRRALSPEDAARLARYEFLAETAKDVGAKIVVVGHHAQDQVETILLHLLRGSGLAGLRGMLPFGPLPGSSDLTLVRPLLQQTRAQIEAYLEQHDLVSIMDETNLDPTYTRNRVRLRLLPELAGYNPQIEQRILQLGSIAAAEEEAAEQTADDIWPSLLIQNGTGWLALDRRRWQRMPLALRRRTLRRAVVTLNRETSDLSFKPVEQAVEMAGRASSGQETRLPGGITMLVDYDRLLFALDPDRLPTDMPQLRKNEAQALLVPGQVALANDWVLTAELVAEKPKDLLLNQDPWQVFVDIADSGKLSVRARVPGERMQPLGMKGHSASLQDIMVNRKLSARLRDKWPVLAAGENAVWLVGHVLDQRVSVTDQSRHLIKLSCERAGTQA